jgi:hypothetical protein
MRPVSGQCVSPRPGTPPAVPSLRPDGDTSVRIHAVVGDLGGVEIDAVRDAKNTAKPMISSALPQEVLNTGDGTRTHDLRIMRPPL